jgi:beta-glucanase (GH16 family)
MKNFLFTCGLALVAALSTQAQFKSTTVTTKTMDKGNVVTHHFDKSKVHNNRVPATFEVRIPTAGRYRISINVNAQNSNGIAWVEDYITNTDERTYNITGDLDFTKSNSSKFIDGAPLNAGTHQMQVNVKEGALVIHSITFSLMQPHLPTPKTYTQSFAGTEWKLVWSDEFNGSGLPDAKKWSYNIGNWGWGNNELQYYTNANVQNARQENGHLIIQAHPQKDGTWTSARLTTQGKQSFTYGKIEFRAKVPTSRGTWAAGWLLGDAYVDELSWPYCGEIDVLECVGFEINDSTGTGLNHATCHTRSYYFKQGNQIGSEIELDSMHTQFHTYAIEWYPHEIKGFVDGVHYYTYDKNADELEWPFNNPQNIILNLAIGGGWGGAQGLDPMLGTPQFIIDYVRVYELTNP